MKKTTETQATGDLAGCMREIWRDYKTGVTSYERLNVHKYTKKYGVQHFPKKLAAELLLKTTEPTETDISLFRAELNKYINMHRGKGGMETLKAELLNEKAAIMILKGKGYRVMKRTTAYIDL